MPAAPLVGAVTTRPPAAFSSLTASAAVQLGRAPFDLHAARQYALVAAAVLDAGLHHLPDSEQALADVGLVTPGLFIFQHHIADAQVVIGTMNQQIDRGGKRVG
jgi:hypothetical protein